MTEQEIIKLIQEKREDVRDIENLPKGLSPEDEIVFAKARRELSIALGQLIEEIEGKRPIEGKKEKNPLLP